MNRAVILFLACGAAGGLIQSAAGQTLSLPAPQAVPAESAAHDSDRVRRINEQIEVRRSQSKLKSRNELAADQAAARGELERLIRLRNGTTSFMTGRSNDADLVALTGLRQQVGHLPTVVAALQGSVPQLGPADFVQQTWREVVETDGRLTPPPRFLRIIDGYEALQEQWALAVEELRQQRRPTDGALVDLEAAVADWSAAVRPPVNAARTVDRREALVWLNRLTLFVRNLDDAQLEDLGRFIRNGGHTFAGGSVGELLTFLIDHRLNLRPGRAGHAALATGTATLLAELDADIAVLEDRIEFYKHHDSAGDSAPPGRMILRPGGVTSEPAPSRPRRETVVPASQPLTLPARNVAEMR